LQPFLGYLTGEQFYFAKLAENGGVGFFCLFGELIEPIFDSDHCLQKLVLGLIADFDSDGFFREDFFDIFGEAAAGRVGALVVDLFEFFFCQADGNEAFGWFGTGHLQERFIENHL